MYCIVNARTSLAAKTYVGKLITYFFELHVSSIACLD